MRVNVSIIRQGDQLLVTCPYNELFIAAAHRRAGKWSKPNWVFDAVDEAWARKTCLRLFGTDGNTRAETVTLCVTFVKEGHYRRRSITVGGRVLARATGKLSGAWLGEGVILEQGGFDSGGSYKNWETVVDAGTTVLLRNFPADFAQKMVEADPEKYSIIDETAA